ncbi:hypothetical protein BOTCAL_0054g00170 [Botryotinia calthae]|uniref:3-hydroxyacyl-CoA dehydrogenase C-terminal domain-containing protein n=1 Tax=Botryotinia calthae TaxID=38488 RepID=A0A4Y8DAL5_9HELO|nr:hypothetical protein BOTCAL_0054g00170 [Botryotinia calthae]
MMPPDNKIVELMTDEETAEEGFPWYVEKLKEVGMHPIVAKRESTGFVFNRVWASVKRECLMILAEGVSTPGELDRVWVEMFGGGKGMGLCAMMDGVGLDTVAFIEEHYLKERRLPSDHTVDFLKKNYLEEGKLGGKSGKGGLYPPGQTTKVAGEEKGYHENLHAPYLYMLDIGLSSMTDTLNAGRVVVGSPDGPSPRRTRHFSEDRSDIKTVIPSGAVHTPKQLIIDHAASKLYCFDREGLRVMRCNFDGSEHETIIQTGDWENPEDAKDQLKWCVGISINNKEGKFSWTQKGFSKGGKGRIFCANIQMHAGQTASTRKDIELLFQELPEPIDLEIDQDTKTLYWTDRGEPPRGNNLNSAKLGDNSLKVLEENTEEKNEYKILTRQLHETIGFKLDTVNKHVYLTDLGGAVYRVGMDGKDKKRVYDEECSFTGIGLTHV